MAASERRERAARKINGFPLPHLAFGTRKGVA